MPSPITVPEDQAILHHFATLYRKPAILNDKRLGNIDLVKDEATRSAILNWIDSLPAEQKALVDLKWALDDWLVASHLYIWGFEGLRNGTLLTEFKKSGMDEHFLPLLAGMPRSRSGWMLAKVTALIAIPNLEEFIKSVSHHLTVPTARRLQASYNLVGSTDAELLKNLLDRIKPSSKKSNNWVSLVADAFQVVIEPELAKSLDALMHLRNIGGHEPTNKTKLGFDPRGEDIISWILATEILAKRIYLAITPVTPTPP